MEEQLEDLCLHLAASRVFSDALKTGDPEAAGKAYAEFFVRFKKAFGNRHKEMLSGDEDYRYEEILTSSAQQPVQTTAQAPEPHIGYDPEAARLLKEQQQKQQLSDSNTGRSF
jgi:hypothetical protein